MSVNSILLTCQHVKMPSCLLSGMSILLAALRLLECSILLECIPLVGYLAPPTVTIVHSRSSTFKVLNHSWWVKQKLQHFLKDFTVAVKYCNPLPPPMCEACVLHD